MKSSPAELIYLADQQAFVRARYSEDDPGMIRESKVIEWALRQAALRASAAPSDGEAIALRNNLREAWAALAMIRETIETLGPVGAVKASEHLDGPTFMHEAEALVVGIVAALPSDLRKAEPVAQGVELERASIIEGLKNTLTFAIGLAWDAERLIPDNEPRRLRNILNNIRQGYLKPAVERLGQYPAALAPATEDGAVTQPSANRAGEA